MEKTKSELTLPIVVGRKYVRRDGVVVVAQKRHPDIDQGCAYVGDGEPTRKGFLHVFLATGRIWDGEGNEAPRDLVADYVEAPAVPDGFTPWGGGEQPAETRGKRIAAFLRAETPEPWFFQADAVRWQHAGLDGDIIAYRLEDEQPAAEPSPHEPGQAAIATLKGMGYEHRGGVQWAPPVGRRVKLPAPAAPAPAPAEAPSGQREHSHAEVLRWIADGHPVQFFRKVGIWIEQSAAETMLDIAHGYAPDRFRLAPPPTITVNGFEVQGGEVREPKEMEVFYYPSPAHSGWVMEGYWTGRDSHRELLARGLVYLGKDRDACVARSKAMVGVQP